MIKFNEFSESVIIAPAGVWAGNPSFTLTIDCFNFFPCSQDVLRRLMKLVLKHCIEDIQNGALDEFITWLDYHRIYLTNGNKRHLKTLDKNIESLKVFNGLYAR